MKVSLLTGGSDTHFALSLAAALISKGINMDFIGGDDMQKSNIFKKENVNYLNFCGKPDIYAPLKNKVARVLKYYFKLVKYAFCSDSKLFHILWLNKFVYFDRTLLNIYYKLLGKKLVFTAHNVNRAKYEERDTWTNRLTLKFMYKIVDHIIVHTDKMKLQLIKDFNIRENKVTIVPFGVYDFVYQSELTATQAKKELNLHGSDKILLFFGRITPQKGLDYLILALARLKEKYGDFKLLIAGRVDIEKGYWENIQKMIDEYNLTEHVLEKIEFIPDEDIEVYFKAADVLILPYRDISQSGPLFMAYKFGLPVIATDVGSFKVDIIEGETGFICCSRDPQDLANKIDLYFQSDLFKHLEVNRNKIIEYANEKYSWEKSGEKIYTLYKNLL